MLKTLIKKELLQQFHTQKFVITSVLSIVLMLLAVHISTGKYEKKLVLFEEAVQGHQEKMRLLKDSSKGQSVNTHFTNIIFRRPTPLSIFCQGKEESFGDAAWVNGFFSRPIGQMDLLNDFDLQEVLNKTFGEIDVILIIKQLFSLMAIFLAFDLVTHEREQDTLKMIHSNQVSRFEVILAKWLTGSLILLIVLLLGFLLSLLYLNLILKIVFSGAELVRLFLLLVFSFLFLWVFFQTALLFSCIIRSSQLSLVGLFLIWIISIFIVPNTAAIAGKYVSPTPPPDHLQIMQEQTPKEQIRSVFNDFMNQLQMQRQRIVLFSYLSPSAVFEFTAECLANTSVADYNQFMEQVNIVREESNKINQSIERIRLYFNSSNANNRLTLKNSVVQAIPFTGWLLMLNSLLFLFIIAYYNRRTQII